jgi:hypothetical protein
VGFESRDAKSDLLDLDDPTELEASLDSGTVPRPTVVPKFDPKKYAEDTEVRGRMPTVTDELALEQARVASLPSDAPPKARPRADSLVEIDAGEADLDALDEGEQVAILRARLHPIERTPKLARNLTELGELLEDPKTAYVLGFVDGILPLETIIEVTGLPELDTLRVLDRMVAQGIVVFDANAPD